MDLFDVMTGLTSTRKMEFQDHWFTTSGWGGLVNDQIAHTQSGDVISTVTPSGSRMVVIVTPFGNVLLEEVNREDRTVILRTTPMLERLWGKGNIPEDQLECLLGLWGSDNIGHTLRKLAQAPLTADQSKHP